MYDSICICFYSSSFCEIIFGLDVGVSGAFPIQPIYIQKRCILFVLLIITHASVINRNPNSEPIERNKKKWKEKKYTYIEYMIKTITEIHMKKNRTKNVQHIFNSSIHCVILLTEKKVFCFFHFFLQCV